MKRLYIDCSMGAAGDMLTGALLELTQDRDEALAMLNGAGVPGIRYAAADSVKCGVKGTHVTVTYNGEEEVTEDVSGVETSQDREHDHDHDHDREDDHDHDYDREDDHDHDHVHEHDHDHDREDDHDHDHNYDHDHNHEHDRTYDHDHVHTHDHDHGHEHLNLDDIENIIHSLKLPESVKEDVIGVYEIIAEAESIAHDEPVSEVHFHEVGSMDAVADAAAVCMLMDKIAPDEVIVSDIHVGAGYVRCAHGVLPVPAPATANILAGLPTYGGEVQGELCTPTGAALLKYFGTEFGTDYETAAGDAGVIIGRGMGRKDFERPNCVTLRLVTD